MYPRCTWISYSRDLDITQLVGGTWWGDPLIGSLPDYAYVDSMHERFGWDPMKGSHASRYTHSLCFVFILWCFYEYISIKIVHLKYYELFLHSKRVVALSQQVLLDSSANGQLCQTWRCQHQVCLWVLTWGVTQQLGHHMCQNN